MIKVLIVYECVPEYLKVYLEDITAEEFIKLGECHNKYVGSDDWEESEWVSNWIEDKKPVFDNTNHNEQPFIFNEKPSAFIVTGFIL